MDNENFENKDNERSHAITMDEAERNKKQGEGFSNFFPPPSPPRTRSPSPSSRNVYEDNNDTENFENKDNERSHAITMDEAERNKRQGEGCSNFFSPPSPPRPRSRSPSSQDVYEYKNDAENYENKDNERSHAVTMDEAERNKRYGEGFANFFYPSSPPRPRSPSPSSQNVPEKRNYAVNYENKDNERSHAITMGEAERNKRQGERMSNFFSPPSPPKPRTFDSRNVYEDNSEAENFENKDNERSHAITMGEAERNKRHSEGHSDFFPQSSQVKPRGLSPSSRNINEERNYESYGVKDNERSHAVTMSEAERNKKQNEGFFNFSSLPSQLTPRPNSRNANEERNYESYENEDNQHSHADAVDEAERNKKQNEGFSDFSQPKPWSPSPNSRNASEEMNDENYEDEYIERSHAVTMDEADRNKRHAESHCDFFPAHSQPNPRTPSPSSRE